jgi:hypothetical protein
MHDQPDKRLHWRELAGKPHRIPALGAERCRFRFLPNEHLSVSEKEGRAARTLQEYAPPRGRELVRVATASLVVWATTEAISAYRGGAEDQASDAGNPAPGLTTAESRGGFISPSLPIYRTNRSSSPPHAERALPRKPGPGRRLIARERRADSSCYVAPRMWRHDGALIIRRPWAGRSKNKTPRGGGVLPVGTSDSGGSGGRPTRLLNFSRAGLT